MQLKKSAKFLILAIFLILISGCETLKGAWFGANEGSQKDWDKLKEVDGWMQKNLW